MLKKGDVCFMLKPNRMHHNFIKVGTPGVITSYTKDPSGETSYLVKFERSAHPRHCEANEIIGRS